MYTVRNLSTAVLYFVLRTTTALLLYELELELIQTQMTQKPILRAEVYARALRASQNCKEDSEVLLRFDQ